MKTITNKIEGNLLVDGEVVLRGMVTGDVTVAAGGSLDLFGMVSGNLILCRHSKTVVRGMVCGDLINQGGSVKVLGMVNGSTSDFTNPIDLQEQR